ncbi:alpha/beta hydrolase [Nocardioides marmorisolisilvae]|uniref:Alpha/beta hydrolase n=1 Tax=Nocardioides marmorisolisilvae TaxID=1542737 RepID=A0A3N0DJF5_9ACTN|nr:alpha/beta hydrolase [Nocardioides marmorisolisilvae]
MTRRGLLAAAAVGVVGCSSRNPAPASNTFRYGNDHADQFGRLRTPGGNARGLVVLVHGGFWSSSYGADLMEPLADDLHEHGYATWNIEYRRLGDGGGWPATFTDVAAAFDLVERLPDKVNGLRPGLPRHALGHSAGGQLVAWAASRTAATPGGPPRFLPERAFSLAGVLDLRTAARRGIGGAAVPQLLGGLPDEVPERYREADPLVLHPRKPVTVVVAADDQVVPASQAAAYLTRHRGPQVERIEVPGDHFALIDPTSNAWKTLRASIDRASPKLAGLGTD